MQDALDKFTIYHNDLDMSLFSHILDGNSQCYKFYWLQAIITVLVREQKLVMTFEELTNEMILAAWYTVAEYHLHMGSPYAGKQDVGALEKIINKIQLLSGLPSTADENDIRSALSEYAKAIEDEKVQLTSMVPQRLLSSYLTLPDRSHKSLKYIYDTIREANDKAEIPFPYIIEYHPRMMKTIIVNEIWADMLIQNHGIILAWIDSKKVRYLQDRNPGVPGIIYKLTKETERTDLTNVRNLWREILKRDEVYDIFTDNRIDESSFAIDHFIPWSYIASDELWNLNPIDRSVNSAKSNGLPEWDLYFPKFLKNQFLLFQWMHADDQIHSCFDKCQNRYLNSMWANTELYNRNHDLAEFGSILSENMKPIYNSAKIQGFDVWRYVDSGS